MTIPRQPPNSRNSGETGRVNQKRRTREAIVDAAVELMDQGVAPTVAQAAEAALVSRTTAYRYFPTQESLLLEISVNLDVDDIEALVATPLAAPDVAARLLDVLTALNRHVAAVRSATARRRAFTSTCGSPPPPLAMTHPSCGKDADGDGSRPPSRRSETSPRSTAAESSPRSPSSPDPRRSPFYATSAT
jgi:AcrR family transcriptional regulator